MYYFVSLTEFSGARASQSVDEANEVGEISENKTAWERRLVIAFLSFVFGFILSQERESKRSVFYALL